MGIFTRVLDVWITCEWQYRRHRHQHQYYHQHDNVTVCLIWILPKKQIWQTEIYLRFGSSPLCATAYLFVLSKFYSKFNIDRSSSRSLVQSIEFQLTIGLNETHSERCKNQMEQRAFFVLIWNLLLLRINQTMRIFFFCDCCCCRRPNEVSIDTTHLASFQFTKRVSEMSRKNHVNVVFFFGLRKNAIDSHVDIERFNTKCHARRLITFAFFINAHFDCPQ